MKVFSSVANEFKRMMHYTVEKKVALFVVLECNRLAVPG